MLNDRIEVWLPIKDFSDYEISSEGRVRHIRFNRLLKVNNSGEYPIIGLNKHGKRYFKKIHRLVAEAFYDIERLDGMEVNHYDGHKHNSHISNLEWTTRSQNVKHAYATGLKKPSGPHPIRKIIIIETGQIFNSAHDCAIHIHGDFSTVCKCLRKNTKNQTHKGYHFEYYED